MLRTLILAYEGFQQHHGSLRASALTFYSLLSLVPLAAMAFGIAKGFGFEQLLEKELLLHFEAQKDVVTQVITFARNMLNNTKGGLIAGIGVAVLFWTVMKVLGNIEDNFNHIWAVTSRSLQRKLSDYLAIMIVGPLLLIMSSSVTVFIAAQVTAISSRIGMRGILDPAVSLGLTLAPYVLIWTLFALLYLIMPNTRVRGGSALLAAIVAGSAYQILQIGYVKFQINVTSYNAIYGSFAALPLFLLWLNASWHIVLVGAEIACAFQSSTDRGRPVSCRSMSMAQTRLHALAICHHVVRRFHLGEPRQTEKQIASELKISEMETRYLTDLLMRGQILSCVKEEDDMREPLLQPAQDTANLTVMKVIEALDQVDANPDMQSDPSKIEPLALCMLELRVLLESAPTNLLLRDIIPLTPDYPRSQSAHPSRKH